jgi:2-succinyl-6-hydroxy-2,4-cyclohexadiene-1-carboxylate synthase
MGSGADWENAISALDERFYCVAPDLPGHGASLRLTPQVYTIKGAAETLRDLLDGLEISRAALVGYSMGGRLAVYLALRHPERCSGLFLESASPGIKDTAERQTRREADEEKARRLESGDFEDFLEDWYRQPLFASLSRHEGLMEKIVETRRRNDPGELARSLRGMGAGSMPSLWKDISGLRVTTLAVSGELDEKHVEISHRMEALSPRIQAAVVPESGHNVHAEASAMYTRLLKDFLEPL